MRDEQLVIDCRRRSLIDFTAEADSINGIL